MRNNLNQYCIGLLFIVCLWSCDQQEVYYEFVSISQSQWSKSNNDACFVLDSVNINPSRKYNINVEITHNVNYEYETLWLNVKQLHQDSIIVSDTLECILINQYGKWLGSGNGPTRQVTISYKTNILLDTTKQNQVCIRHAMDNLQLKGIEKIGLKIY